MKGVLVFADGRTSAVDDCNGALWYVLARELDYSKRRFFYMADIARQIPNPEHPVWVYTERPQVDYDAHIRKMSTPRHGEGRDG